MTDIKNNSINFIVENAINTCYIDSLLIGLFYDESIIDRLLTSDIKDDLNAGLIIYLQEFIKYNFVDNVRANKSVLREIMDTMRSLFLEVGWNNYIQDDYMEQQDVNEFFTFLLNVFNGPLLELQRTTIIENGMSENEEVGNVEKIPFIPLSIPTDNSKTSLQIKDLLKIWLFDNYSDIKRSIKTDNGYTEVSVIGLNSYHIINVPYIVGISINRFKNDGKRDNIHIDIQKKIRLHNNISSFNPHSWVFHSAICHKGDSLKFGHYYTLVCKKISKNTYKYYKFDDLNTPCLEEVSMSDPEITNQLKTECVFIIYKYST